MARGTEYRCVGGSLQSSLEKLKEAIDAGLSMFTHLGNGCPMQMHRHDNIIQRVLSLSDDLLCCFIADGAHINFTALKNYINCAGFDRSIIVTDAISAAGLGPGQYTLGNWNIQVGEDMVARSPKGDHLVGSTVTIPRSVENLTGLGFSAAQIDKLIAENPRRH